MGKPVPFERKWLEEAHKIFKGDKNIKPKREHIIAAMTTLVSFSKDAETLRGLMRKVFDEAAQRRKEQGLPIPEKPPGLDANIKLPWN